MKKMILVVLALCIALPAYARKGNLYERFKDYPEIKIYLQGVTDSSKVSNVNVDTFKKLFKEIVPERLNISFANANSLAGADVAVTADIVGFAYKDKVNPRLFLGTVGILADTMAPKGLARMSTDYTITDAKTGELLMEMKMFNTDENRPAEEMTEDNAFTYGATKNINRFIYRAFYEQKD